MKIQFYKTITCLCILSLYISTSQSRNPYPRPSSENPEYWKTLAKQDLKDAKTAHQSTILHGAKNAILFLGDGMGIPTVTSGRILKGQLKGTAGEESVLTFESFPHIALIKTYNTDRQTPDSAGTATAYLSGVKTASGVMGINENVQFENCSSYNPQNNVISFLRMAKQAGKSIGLITTTRVTHATPGAAYCHTASRMWEDDTDRNKNVPEGERSRCPDIAAQMIDLGIDFNVILGGGRNKFLPKNVTTRDSFRGTLVNGTRSDGVNLINVWKSRQAALNRKYKYVETLEELKKADTADADYVLGLFNPSHMMFHAVNTQARPVVVEPTLEEMTEFAIKLLQKNEKGFAIMIEGGRIDHGHHDNRPVLALHDLQAFEQAIVAAQIMTKLEETLTVVTADHSHVFSIGGWGTRGNPIFGKSLFSWYNKYNSKGEALGDDNLPYTVLSYGDGPGGAINTSRSDITDSDTEALNFRNQALVSAEIESHGADDVPLYARGPGSYLFHKTHEQSYVAHVIMHSLCVGEYAVSNNCLPSKNKNSVIIKSSFIIVLSSLILTFVF